MRRFGCLFLNIPIWVAAVKPFLNAGWGSEQGSKGASRGRVYTMNKDYIAWIKGAEGQKPRNNHLGEPTGGRHHNAGGIEIRRLLQSLLKYKVLRAEASLVEMARSGPDPSSSSACRCVMCRREPSPSLRQTAQRCSGVHRNAKFDIGDCCGGYSNAGECQEYI
jgi:hypothetical protein